MNSSRSLNTRHWVSLDLCLGFPAPAYFCTTVLLMPYIIHFLEYTTDGWVGTSIGKILASKSNSIAAMLHFCDTPEGVYRDTWAWRTPPSYATHSIRHALCICVMHGRSTEVKELAIAGLNTSGFEACSHCLPSALRELQFFLDGSPRHPYFWRSPIDCIMQMAAGRGKEIFEAEFWFVWIGRQPCSQWHAFCGLPNRINSSSLILSLYKDSKC